jgi:hypothetical protein
MKEDVNLSRKEFEDNRKRIYDALSERSNELFRSDLEDKKIAAKEKEYKIRLENDLVKLDELYKNKYALEEVLQKNRSSLQAQKDLEAANRKIMDIKAGMDMKGLDLANNIAIENARQVNRISIKDLEQRYWKEIYDMNAGSSKGGKGSSGDVNKPSPIPGVNLEDYNYLVSENYSDRQIIEYRKNPMGFSEDPEGRGTSSPQPKGTNGTAGTKGKAGTASPAGKGAPATQPKSPAGGVVQAADSLAEFSDIEF